MRIEYLPTRETTFHAFRYWHVEPLLNQAADLIDRCKDELKLYNSLRVSETQLNLEMQELQEEINLEKGRLELFERDLLIAKDKGNFYTSSVPNFESMMREAKAAYQKEAEGDHKGSGWAKAGQNKAEVRQRINQQNLDRGLNAKQMAWAESDKYYYQLRLAYKEKMLAKKQELAENFNPFGFAKQRELAFQRLQVYYKDTADRAFVANEGLKLIYNYEDNLDFNFERTDPNEAVNYLAKWISKAIAWLVAYGQLDQSITKSISLLGLLTTEDLNRFFSSANSCFLTAKISNEIIAGYENLRLRGICATIIGTAGLSPWSMEVRLPKKAIYIRNQIEYPIDQSALPSCFLGRVENKDSTRSPEICGQVSLINASPLAFNNEVSSFWSFKIFKPAYTDLGFESIKDIIIELNLMGKPHI